MSQKKQKEIDLESLTPEEKVKYEIAEELGGDFFLGQEIFDKIVFS